MFVRILDNLLEADFTNYLYITKWHVGVLFSYLATVES